MSDPEKGRTGSFLHGGGFLRVALHIVAYPAAMSTICSVVANPAIGGGGLCPAPPPCYASGYCRKVKKSDHAGIGIMLLQMVNICMLIGFMLIFITVTIFLKLYFT